MQGVVDMERRYAKREEACTHRQNRDEVKGKKSQLDCIIGTIDRCDDVRICTDHKAWATCDHYPKNARICDDDLAVPVKNGRKIGVGGSLDRKYYRRNT